MTAMTRAASDLASLSVRRPYLATVMSLLIIVAGIGAVFGVEVRELPDVDRPVVSVSANYPGASPETIDAEVTAKIEGAVARVAGIVAVRSASEEGNFRVRVTFQPSTDVIASANDIREAVARIQRTLPEGVQNVRIVKADADAGAIVQLAVLSAKLSLDDVTERVRTDIVPALTSVPGVADVRVSGDGRRTLRVVVDPLKLASHQLSIADVVRALETARYDQPAGNLLSGDQTLLIRADASVPDPDAVARIILRAPVRLGDVATAHFGVETPTSIARLNGSRIITLGIVRRAGSNTVAISDGVKETVERLNRRMTDLSIVATSDDAVFIRSAINEVFLSLGLAVLIVVGIILAFLGQLRAALIPAVTIPVALIGTIAVIWLLGFSINLVTLLALVLATGLVVDDAIVVLENISRLKAEGTPPRAAAVIGTRQVFFAVIATTASLVSVFLPISFLPSTAGRLFAEFGVVLSVAVCISSFVALSLVAMLASRLPETPPDQFEADDRAGGHQENRLSLRSKVGERVANVYAGLVGATLAFPLTMVGVSLLIVSLSAIAYGMLKEEFVPKADRGEVTVGLRAPPGVGLGFTDRQVEKVEALLQPYFESGVATGILSVTGRYDPNYAEVRAQLVDWSERRLSEGDISRAVNKGLATIPAARAYSWTGNSLNVSGGGRNVGLSFAITGGDYAEIARVSRAFVEKLKQEVPELRYPSIDYRAAQPQVSIVIDRKRAALLDVPLDDIARSLRALVERLQVTELTIDDRRVPVIIEATSGSVTSPGDLQNVSIAARDGRLVPLAQFISFTEKPVPDELRRQGQRRAVQVSGQLADGASMRAVVGKVQALADGMLPQSMGLLPLGEAATLNETASGISTTFAVAFIVVFLVLIAQFESLTSALVVLLTIPLGICAAVFALLLTGTTLNIFSQIGVLMLIGIMAKNAILMVEFADQLRDKGADVLEAAREASLIRLRPIMMTMLSTVLAGLPLILSAGAGAEARSSIGWVVFGGLGVAALFTLFLTPALYVLIAWMSKPRAAEQHRVTQELREANAL